MPLHAGGRWRSRDNAASANKAPLTLSQVKDHGKVQLSSLQSPAASVRASRTLLSTAERWRA